MVTVSNEDLTRKDTNMKLLLIFAAVLAFSLAEEEKKKEILDDSEAEASASVELLKEGADLNVAASTYNAYVPPSQRPPQWNQPNYVPPQNTWIPPKQEPAQPLQPVINGMPENVQNDDYYFVHHHHYPKPEWSTPSQYPTTAPTQYPTNPPPRPPTTPVYQTHPPTTTTPVPVIKNEQYFGENGDYKYEYQIADGTHVGEQGYFTDPKRTDESLVKKGWYSFVGADGKTYTVTYWADHTGFHAYGDHLPTAPPPPPYVQTNTEKYKPQNDYPSQTPAPGHYPTQAPVYYPSQPTYKPVQNPTYVPPQQPSYPPPQVPSYQPPQNFPQQPLYNPPQTYYPPQQNHYPH